jgi:NAD(P)-dependent dehydrogenase (short-subunit alcohol dehydrogenase family)
VSRVVYHAGRDPCGYYPFIARKLNKQSASTTAIIASPTGTARMPTQGSCRPLVTISVFSPALVMVSTGVRMLLVGFTAKRTTTGWPLEIPLKRNTTIEDVGGAALFLLSELGQGTTGENIHVDGGYHVVGMKAIDAPDIALV